MRWTDVCTSHPDRWLLIEALQAQTENRRRVLDEVAVVEVCRDGVAAMQRYRELRHDHPERELYFVRTAIVARRARRRLARYPVLDIEERPWLGIRRNDAPHAAR